MNKSIVFFDSTTDLINPKDEAFFNKNLVELVLQNDKSIDFLLTNIIHNHLVSEEFTNIIIPACFGNILSDFLGLRIATHIRCTLGINQQSNIFLYSFTGIQDYFSHEYFNILRTQGVFLIDYNIETIIKSCTINKNYLSKDNLINEVKKIKIEIPLNYEDSHSLANEWAIYRWANTIKAIDKGIAKIESKLKNDLYYKYLKTIHPINDFETLKSQELKLNFKGEPTILYIDDEAEKGWREIFEKIIIEENDIDFLHLDNDFNGKSKKDIVEISMDTIKKENVDVVILDFRLHKDDFENTPIQEITGYQILKKIKEYNKGIQVIVFSATNKIWNLIAIQEYADGFILKESPENSFDSSFTKQSVLNMIVSINNCLEMIFLIDTYKNIENIKKHIMSISNSTGNLGLDEGLLKMKFKNEIFIQLDIIYDCLKRSSQNISTLVNDESSYLNLSFISIFKILELINDYYINEHGTVLKSGTPIQSYNQQSDSFIKFKNKYPTTRDKIITVINFDLNSPPKNYYHKISTYINFRNNIIHPKKLRDYKKTTKDENLAFLILITDLIIKIE